MTSPTAPSARARDADATRLDLLHAAMRRFTVLGYERTTSRDIAADAGVNVSLINRYFGSKDGLFRAVMTESVQSLDQVMLTGQDDLVDSMVRQLDPATWTEFGSEHPLLMLLRPDGRDDRVGQLRRRSLDKIVARLAELADPRSPPDPADAALRAELVLALVVGVLTLRRARPDGALGTTDPAAVRAALARTTTAILDGP